MKILFVTEKWCDGEPKLGLTNNYHNLFGSLKAARLGVKFSTIHYDEFFLKYQRHIDEAIPAVYEKTKPDLVIVSLLGTSWLNPSKNSFKYLKQKDATVCFMWPDTGYDWAINTINDIGHLVDLHVSWGGEQRNHKYSDKQLWLWAPQDEKLYFKKDNKSIDASFIGSLQGYKERKLYIDHILNNGVDILIAGGQREGKLTQEEYAEYIRDSKIGINFPESPSGIDQCKGRVIEIISCGSMLLERSNKATQKLLTPNEDYIEFDGLSDFVDKVQYFIRNEKERKAIALNGYNKYCKNYSASIFWKRVLEGCGYEL